MHSSPVVCVCAVCGTRLFLLWASASLQSVCELAFAPGFAVLSLFVFFLCSSLRLPLSLSVALFPPSWVSLSRSQADSLPLSHSVFIIYLSTYLTAFRSLFQSLFLSLSFSLSGELSEFCCCMLIFLSLHLSISLLICLLLYFFTHPLLFLLFLMIILFL